MLTHVFEEAKLGVAPFRLVRIEIRKYRAHPDAPVQPGTSCDYCGTGIMETCIIRDANGHEFKVGNNCVYKTGDRGLVDTVKRAANKLRREAKLQKDVARIDAAKELLTDLRVQAALAAMPHPFAHFAEQGKTYLDYVGWMMFNGGISGRVGVSKVIERIAKEVLCK